ncbi:MAG: hypothetical protein ACK5KQ_03510 [Anaerorhabdus sp.]
MFEWISTTKSPQVTMYSNNVSLNSTAANFFLNSRYCCVGIDQENLRVAIRPVTKREVDLGLVDKLQLHKITVGSGYARVTNKEIANSINNLVKNPEEGMKFHAKFDHKENYLVFYLKDKIIKGGG